MVPALADASSNPLNAACQTDDQTRSSAICQQAGSQGTNNPIAGPNGIINKAASIIALIAGVAAVIMIIISGIRFVTAGGAVGGQRAGDSNSAKAARATMTNAVIGLILVVLAWAIVDLVTTKIIK